MEGRGTALGNEDINRATPSFAIETGRATLGRGIAEQERAMSFGEANQRRNRKS